LPELPEVETMRRGILPLLGGRITAVERLPCPRRPLTIAPRGEKFARLQTGQTIDEIERLGKRIVLRLSNELAVVIEPRMTGLVLLADPPSRDHLRICWRIRGAAAKAMWFWDRRGLGVVRVVDAKQFDRYYGPHKIGPDALAIDAAAFVERLQASRRAIKVALLDQRALAGVGNLYAAEICHLARVHPATRCDRIRADEWTRLHGATLEILADAVRNEGSTLGDGTYRNVLNQHGSYQNSHRVYDRKGEICTSCGQTEIIRIVQTQRATFFCPACQPKSRRLVASVTSTTLPAKNRATQDKSSPKSAGGKKRVASRRSEGV